MNWKVVIFLSFVVLALGSLAGCPREWHFAITGIDNTSKPQFCVTMRPGCSGDGVGLGVFGVQEVSPTNSGKPYRTVWLIQPKTNEPLRNFTYGVTPSGWEQTIAPEQLRPGAIYSVGPYWFRLKEEEGKLSYEVAPMGQLR